MSNVKETPSIHTSFIAPVVFYIKDPCKIMIT